MSRLLAVLCALSLLGLACDKDEKKSDDTKSEDKKDESKKDESKPGKADGDDKKAEAEKPAAPSSPGGAPAKTGFAVFPADSEMVFAISATSARKSSLWNKFKDPLTAPLYANKDWKEFYSVCKLNPIEEIESMLIGGKPEQEKKIVMVIKGLSKSEIKDCAAKIEAHDNSMKVAEEGNLMQLKAPGQEIWMAWLDDNTFLTAADVTDKAHIAERAGGKNGLDTNETFTSILSNVDSNATLWFAVVPSPNSDMGRQMANVPGGAPKGIFGSILLEGGLGLDVGARLNSEDQAKMLHAEGQKQLPAAKAQAGPLGKYIEKVQLNQKGSDILIQAKFSQKEFDGLIGDLEKMLGASFGAMIKSAM